jgi:Tfp pilus assembly protein PilF
MTDIAGNLERMLADGQETAVLRFSLGNAYLKRDPARAINHFGRAVELDPGYSAAWKLLGKTQASTEQFVEARASFEAGIRAAEANGDIQAAKEMRVFLKRLPDGQR